MELQKFILENKDWKEKLSIAPYFLSWNTDGNYIIFNYSQLYSDFSNPIVKEARGCIFEMNTWRCVCRAFDKFFNYGEPNCAQLEWEKGVAVQEKIDGSLMKVWNYGGEWHLSTNKTIDAFKATLGDIEQKSFGDLFVRALKEYGFPDFETFCSMLLPQRTYIFELATFKNRVVIPYEGYHIFYLGTRDMVTMKESCEIDKWYDLEVPKRFKLKILEDVTTSARDLPWDEEGYVVVDTNWNRCKIKSTEYVRAHYVRNNNVVTRVRLIDVLLQNQYDEFIIYAGDYKEVLDSLKEKMKKIEARANAELKRVREMNIGDKKEYVFYVKATAPKFFHNFLFFAYDEIKDWAQYTKLWNGKKWDAFLEMYKEE